jgi:hypothetical protein
MGAIMGIGIPLGVEIAYIINLDVNEDVTKNNLYWRLNFGFILVFCVIRLLCLLFIYRKDTPVYYLTMLKNDE